MAITLSSLLVACSGGGTTIDDPEIGVFNDAPVKGLIYSSISYSGVTNEKGEFNYKEGEVVTFKLADITLGTVNAKTEVNVTELNNGVEIARLLQSLDTDPEDALIDVSEIVIPESIQTSISEVLAKDEGDLDSVFTQEVMDEIESTSNVVLVQDNPVTVDEAIDHITDNVTTSTTLEDFNNQAFITISEENPFVHIFFDTGEWIGYEEEEEEGGLDSECNVVSSSFKGSIEINGNSGTMVAEDYDNGTCSGTPTTLNTSYEIAYLDEFESSECDNAQTVNFIPVSASINGVSLTQAQLDQAIEDKDVSGPSPYNSICSTGSSTGDKLYLSDTDSDSDGGHTESTRLTDIQTGFYLVKE